MTESLLSFSEVLLFGRTVDDLKLKKDTRVRVAIIDDSITTKPDITDDKIDDVTVEVGDKVLVQVNNSEISGVYKIKKTGTDLVLSDRRTEPKGDFVFVKKGSKHKRTFWKQVAKVDGSPEAQEFKFKGKRRRGKGVNNFLGDQFLDGGRLARIYGFSYEGVYYELPEPVIFLVHGDGDFVNQEGDDDNAPGNLAARAPNNPNLTGVASADFQFADDIRVWDYNKADFTIRMDVMTGQFEQVLLDIYFGFDSPAIGGAKVSGAKVSGAKVSGAKVSGAKVSGAKVSGAKARGGD
ncbi:TrkA C-terminal domain-containing protein [Ruegeria halocynthiae]|uniref:TrkA C-terminal domain-containing protein n=1 Tax=Ruegeria halocynthiae TaxID=985054 RepID=UPI00055F0A57|nr:TrkA C-terminal domain-containing protein [Ruegeria halocynthiae]